MFLDAIIDVKARNELEIVLNNKTHKYHGCCIHLVKNKTHLVKNHGCIHFVNNKIHLVKNHGCMHLVRNKIHQPIPILNVFLLCADGLLRYLAFR